MGGELPTELSASVLEWVADAKSALERCERLVQWQGEAGDYNRLRKSLEYVWDALAITENFATGALDLCVPMPRPKGKLTHFVCGRRTAQVLSPVLETFVSDEPQFVCLALSSLPESEAKQLVGSYGLVRGAIGYFLCGNMWKQYPEFAPNGWNVASGSSSNS